MTIDQGLKMMDITVSFMKEALWPVLLFGIFVYFKAGISQFFANLSELTFKFGGGELTAKSRVEAAALMGVALATRAQDRTVDIVDRDRVREIAGAVNSTFAKGTDRSLRKSHLLWVDDRPQNNVYEKRAFEALGLQVTNSLDTTDALEKIRNTKYDIIVSDMGRPPDMQAGYTLLEELRKSGNQTPFIIYAGSNSPEHKTLAKQRGAMDCTNNPQELLQMVLTTIVGVP